MPAEIEAKLRELIRVDATDPQACLQVGCSVSEYLRKLIPDVRCREKMRVAQKSFPDRPIKTALPGRLLLFIGRFWWHAPGA